MAKASSTSMPRHLTVLSILGTDAAQRHDGTDTDEPPSHSYPCPCCGGRMIVIETFGRGYLPTTSIRVDTSWLRSVSPSANAEVIRHRSIG
jgi:hypothetical protein